MAYSKNPQLPYVRAEAIRLVQQGWSARKVARHFGFSHGAVLNWLKRGVEYGPHRRFIIPTRSSRPDTHPHALSPEIVSAILGYRRERQQCAEILHHRLGRDGYRVSLSSVKRVLRRHEMTRFSRWKKWHSYPPRPLAEKPGILVQVDTIWQGKPEHRLRVYTLLDVCSRWAYAAPSGVINTHRSLRFVEQARRVAPFSFLNVQSDHGSEFSKWFTKRIGERGMAHRHSRVRTPTDNGHLERFNRTIQEECLARIPYSFSSWQKELPEYLRYYNEERPHMGLDMKTPLEVVRSY